MTRFLCALLLIVAAPACADIFTAPCTKYRVPASLARAIARVESAGNPYAVNVAGRSYQVRSKAEALQIITNARKKGLSHDVGLMQVNSRWLRNYGVNPAVALEPECNVWLGVWILACEIHRHGLNWTAVGAYHSPNPRRRAGYAYTVWRNYVSEVRRDGGQ